MKNKYYDEFLDGDADPIDQLHLEESDDSWKNLLKDVDSLGRAEYDKVQKKRINLLCIFCVAQSIALLGMVSKCL